MSVLVYCYGPFSVEKSLFCKNFSKVNPEFKLIECNKIRKKISGSIAPGSKITELKTIQEINKICIDTLGSSKKKNNILLDGLLLSKQSRLNLIESLTDNENIPNLKKVAVSFCAESATDCFEKNKDDNDLKNIDFDTIRSQFLNFKIASTKEEADLLISKIEEYDGKIDLETKLWGKDSIINCDNLKKVAEYFKHINSF